MQPISFGFSPCPNDTFILDALIHKKIDTRGYEFKWVIEDVEHLNQLSINKEISVSKMSYATFAKLTKDFQLIPYGSALGKGCGPLLISKHSITNLENATVGIPGFNTTANMLLTLAYPQIKHKKEMLFSSIEEALQDEKIDLGLIIHENRFTYLDNGLQKIRDLGDFWEESTGHYIPLGGFAINRGLNPQTKRDISELIKESVEFAFKNPESSKNFVKKHAQEMNAEVINSHIKLYVNEFSKDLGTKGRTSIEFLLDSAVKNGISDKIFFPIFVD